MVLPSTPTGEPLSEPVMGRAIVLLRLGNHVVVEVDNDQRGLTRGRQGEGVYAEGSDHDGSRPLPETKRKLVPLDGHLELVKCHGEHIRRPQGERSFTSTNHIFKSYTL